MAHKQPYYRLSPKAESDLENIWRYSAEHWSDSQADRYVNEIFSACGDLARGIRKGRNVPIRSGYLKYPVASHFIYYRFRTDQLHVIRILHQRMDLERHL